MFYKEMSEERQIWSNGLYIVKKQGCEVGPFMVIGTFGST